MEESNYKRKLVALLHADVADYSRLTERNESETYAQLSQSLDLIADRVRNAGGLVVRYAGDAVLASFDSVVAAMNCAIGIQQATSALRADYDRDRRLLFRIGINFGEVIVDQGDLYGDHVNLAARLEGVAKPGGICISAAVHDQVVGKVDAAFEDFGEVELKNIARPIRAYHVSPEALSGNELDTMSGDLARFSAYTALTGPGRVGEAAIDLQAPDRPSLMIMPFSNLGSKDDAPLAHGLQLAIQSVFVRLSGLFLLSPAASNTYRGREISAVKAGNAVGVRYVLEGAVQIANGRMRATVQLTDAPQAKIIWTERYDRDLEDVFEVQDEVATGVATALHVQLNRKDPTELQWWEQRKMLNWRTRTKVLQALSHAYKGTEADNKLARRLNKELLAELPQDKQGQALALIALSHWADAFRGWSKSPEHSLAQARDFALKALTQDYDPDGWARLVLGYVRLFEREHEQALSLLDAATTQRPNCPVSGAISGEVLKYCGEPDRAVDAVKKAIRKARVYPPWMAKVLAESYRDAGELTTSTIAAQEALRLDPNNIGALVVMTTNYSLAGRVQDARQCADRLLQLHPSFSVERFGATQPYRLQNSLEKITDALQQAGLPN